MYLNKYWNILTVNGSKIKQHKGAFLKGQGPVLLCRQLSSPSVLTQCLLTPLVTNGAEEATEVSGLSGTGIRKMLTKIMVSQLAL